MNWKDTNFTLDTQTNMVLARQAMEDLNMTHFDVIDKRISFSEQEKRFFTLQAREEANVMDLHNKARQFYIRNRVKALKEQAISDFFGTVEHMNACANGVQRYALNMVFHVWGRYNTEQKHHAQAERFRKMPFDLKKDVAQDACENFWKIISNAENMFKLLEKYETESIPFELAFAIASYKAMSNAMGKRVREQKKECKAVEHATKYGCFIDNAKGTQTDLIETTEFYVSMLNLIPDEKDRFVLFASMDGYKTSEILEAYNEKFGINEQYRNLYRRLEKVKGIVAKAYNINYKVKK